MQLRELLNTCMNTYIKGLTENPLFTCKILFENKSENILESDYILKANYTDDDNYLEKYRTREVKYWYAEGRNDLIVEIEGSY